MRLQLGVSTKYVPEWGTFEAIREAVQNALDAEDKGFDKDIVHVGETLYISNQGVKLNPKVWLLGQTSKAGDKTQRGKFGEGLTVGTMVALRSGLQIEITNDDEIWAPTLEKHEAIDEDVEVLTISVSKTKIKTGEFMVKIRGVTPEMWSSAKEKFLSLSEPRDTVPVKGYGSILLDPGQQGKVYVKGIFIQKDEQLAYGYDFQDIRVDRDRKMADQWQLESNSAKMWRYACEANIELASTHMVPMLMGACKDLNNLRYQEKGRIHEILAKIFLDTYGPNARPVNNHSQATELGHLGYLGVVLPPAFVEILANVMGTFDKIRTNLETQLDRKYDFTELSGAERETYHQVLSILERAAAKLGYEPITPRTSFVDFRKKTINGLHKGNGEILLSKKLLSNRSELLRVLTHEVAHDRGLDGEKAHEFAQGQLFSYVIERFVFEAIENRVVKLAH